MLPIFITNIKAPSLRRQFIHSRCRPRKPSSSTPEVSCFHSCFILHQHLLCFFVLSPSLSVTSDNAYRSVTFSVSVSECKSLLMCEPEWKCASHLQLYWYFVLDLCHREHNSSCSHVGGRQREATVCTTTKTCLRCYTKNTNLPRSPECWLYKHTPRGTKIYY